MNLEKAFSNSRLCKALTGLSKEEFLVLVPTFQKTWIDSCFQKPNRLRKPGGGRRGKLSTTKSKLFFILLYMKVYPIYDVLGFLTDRKRTHCCRSVQTILPILKKTLGRSLVLPKRKISSPEEFFRLFPETKDIFIDGTKRRVERPKNLKKRNKLYPGKKKTTTRKTVVVNDQKKRIPVLTKTHAGRRHNKKIADKHGLVSGLPPDVTAWTDMGFLGMQKNALEHNE